jgi:hypothetical protein
VAPPSEGNAPALLESKDARGAALLFWAKVALGTTIALATIAAIKSWLVLMIDAFSLNFPVFACVAVMNDMSAVRLLPKRFIESYDDGSCFRRSNRLRYVNAMHKCDQTTFSLM